MGDETIIVTPATAQSLSFESEGNAGNTHENFRETFAVENFRRRRRLEDSVRTGDKRGAIANPSGNDHAHIDARIEDGAIRLQRVGKDEVRGNLITDSGVQNNCGGFAVVLARDQVALHSL